MSASLLIVLHPAFSAPVIHIHIERFIGKPQNALVNDVRFDLIIDISDSASSRNDAASRHNLISSTLLSVPAGGDKSGSSVANSGA